MRHGEVCLGYSAELAPFYLGYAHEALARAQALAGKFDQAQQQLTLAKDLAVRIIDKAERELLEGDLANIPVTP